MSLRTHGDFGEVVIVEGKVMNVQANPSLYLFPQVLIASYTLM